MTLSPISVLFISLSPFSWKKSSILFTIFSIKFILIGLFSHAYFNPLHILIRLKGSLLPSFLMTKGSASSALSLVVNLFRQLRHSLLRRIVSLSLPSRESTTLLSKCPQKGHFIRYRHITGFQILRIISRILCFLLKPQILLIRLNFSTLTLDSFNIFLANSSA